MNEHNILGAILAGGQSKRMVKINSFLSSIIKNLLNIQ